MLVKHSENVGYNSGVVVASNYVAGSVVGILLIVFTGGTTADFSTLWIGLVGGILWPLPFFIMARTINALGVAIAAPLARFGLIIPVLFGLIFLGEGLSIPSWIGLFAALLAIILISPLDANSLQHVDRQALWLIPLMILLIGLANLWINVFNTIGLPDETYLFFTLLYIFSALFSSLAVLARRIPIRWAAVRRGFLIGVFNFSYTYALLASLRAPIFQNNSAIVYTLVNVGIMLTVFIAGIIIWRERVTRRNIAGVGVAVVALVLLNLG
ncbi:MAG: GRP family sugar transporter [Chloroflexota bacterium]